MQLKYAIYKKSKSNNIEIHQPILINNETPTYIQTNKKRKELLDVFICSSNAHEIISEFKVLKSSTRFS